MNLIELINWGKNFRNSRKSTPLGEPLWAYKLTDIEFHELQTLLTDLTLTKGLKNLINCYQSAYAEAFVMFVSTWLQRHSSGRKKWEPVLDAIGANSMDPPDRNELVKLGLRSWGLGVYNTDNSARYLASLLCQGGFPRSDLLLESSSHIMDYFEKVLVQYESYQHVDTLESIAIDKLNLLPITLQQKSFAILITRLIEKLLDWKSLYDLSEYKDAVKILDVSNSSWRQELPFLVIDEEAKNLIDKLLKRASKFKPRELHPIRIKRRITPAGDNFRLTSEIYISREIHPEDLERQLGKISLPNSFFINTNTDDENQFRTASFTLASGPNGGWKVSHYHTQVKNSVAAGELSYSLDSDGHQFSTGVYYRGETLEPTMPWVFEDSGSTLNYIGQGSIRTNRDRLYVVHELQPSPETELSTVKKLGSLISSSKTIYEITGSVTICGLSGNYRIHCKSGTNNEMSVVIDSQPYQELNAKIPVFRGVPVVRCKDIANTNTVNDEELFWYQPKSKSQLSIHDPDAIGSGFLVWKKNHTVIWEKQIILLPKLFNYQLNHIENLRFSLKLFNSQNPKLGSQIGFESWIHKEPIYENGDLQVDIIPKSDESEAIGLKLYWGNNPNTECEIDIPISYNMASIVDRRGNFYNEREQGNLTINELSNLRVRIRADRDFEEIRVVANLYSITTDNSYEQKLISHQTNIKAQSNNGLILLKGLELSDLCRMLIRQTDVLDISIGLIFFVNNKIVNHSIPRIKRYKHDLTLLNDENKIHLPLTPYLRSIESPCLLLSPVWDFHRDPVEIYPDNEITDILQFSIPTINDKDFGPWLIWAQPEMSMRPRIKNYEIPKRRLDPAKMTAIGAKLHAELYKNSLPEPTFKESLSENTIGHRVKYLDVNDNSSVSKLNKSIKNIGNDIFHKDWDYFDGVMKHLDSINPLSLYALTSLQRNPRTLAALLFRDSDNFFRYWDLAERLGISWYLIPVRDWTHVIHQYFLKYKSISEPLRNIDETLFWESIYRHFSNFESKGPYFKYLVDIATDRPCFEPVAIWENEEIRNNGLKDQTIGSMFCVERKLLFDRHNGILMNRVGIKKETTDFIDWAESQFPTENGLPPQIFEFFKYSNINDEKSENKASAWSLTMKLPLQIGLYMSGYYSPKHVRKFIIRLRYALSKLDEFDREWLQKVLIISHMTTDLIHLESKVDNAEEASL